jgi:microsomal prostaglandin-E synthase 2
MRATASLELNVRTFFFFPLQVANQWLGATAMWLAQGKIKKKYNITDERKALHECVERWTSAVGKKVFFP